MKTELIKCKKCRKKFQLEYIKYPCKTEESRSWETFYVCPYCDDVTNVRLSSDEDIQTSTVEFE